MEGFRVAAQGTVALPAWMKALYVWLYGLDPVKNAVIAELSNAADCRGECGVCV